MFRWLGADLCYEKNTANWLVAGADLFSEKNTGWWLIRQTNKLNITVILYRIRLTR
jgi:hypothetical protein